MLRRYPCLRNSSFQGSPTEYAEFTEPSAGRIHSASSSVGSVHSVGEYTQQAVLCESVKSVGEYTQQAVLCKSVDSVGEYTQQAVLWVLWIPWGNTLSKQFCVNLLSMLKSKCFDHYFHFKLRFYIQG